MYLINEYDAEKIHTRKVELVNSLTQQLGDTINKPLFEHDRSKLSNIIMNEAVELEKIIILEGISDMEFGKLKNQFLSMSKAANGIIRGLPGTELSKKMDYLKSNCEQLLDELSAEIRVEGAPTTKKISKLRDVFYKSFVDFSILFKGMMACADLFDESSKNEIQQIQHSLSTQEELLSEPVGQALQTYDTGNDAEVPLMKGSFLFRRGEKGLLKKFKNTILRTIKSTSPGFFKLVGESSFMDSLLAKSFDHLSAVFNRFEDLVAGNVDEEFLLKTTKSPISLKSIMKSIFDAFSSGKMKTIK